MWWKRHINNYATKRNFKVTPHMNPATDYSSSIDGTRKASIAIFSIRRTNASWNVIGWINIATGTLSTTHSLIPSMI